MTGGAGNEFFAGGAGNDTITTSTGADVIAFNRGDGQDTVTSSTGKDNTISLGHGIVQADLLFKKSANDLTLVTGASEQVTLKDRYANTANQSVTTLQVVIEGTGDYNSGSTNATLKSKVERFNFDSLTTAFDQARAANAALTSWSFSGALLNFHLGGSDTAAIRGDLAYQYASVGDLSSFSMNPAMSVLGTTQFGTSAQNLQTPAALRDTGPRLQ